MLDHNFVSEDGQKTPVARLSTPLIQELLHEGIQITDYDGVVATPENVLERLRIELTARQLGLSGV